MENRKASWMERKNISISEDNTARKGLLFAIAFLLTLVCIFTGSYTEELNTVQVGSVAEKRYVAMQDAVDEVMTNRLREAAAESVGPIYEKDASAEENSRTAVRETFQEVNTVLSSLKEGETLWEKIQETSLKLPVLVSAKQVSAYENLKKEERTLFMEDCIAVMQEIYEQGITADALEKSREQAKENFAATEWNSSLQELAGVLFSAALEPNLLPDEEAMEAAREEKRREVSDVMVRKNQKIVDEGEIITQDIYDRLVGLGLVGKADYQAGMFPLFGSFIMVSLLFAAVYLFFLWGKGKTVVLKQNEIKMLFTVYVMMLLLLRATAHFTNFALIPLGLFSMLLSILIGRRMALIMNTLFCIIGCFIFNGDERFLMYTLLVGTLGAVLIQKTEQRQYVVRVAAAMGAVSFLSMLAVGLFFGNGYSKELLTESAAGALMGMISVILTVGSLPFWEATFDANTPSRMLELTNPNNDLLHRLMLEAPGTYHHSLIVANLAETAAYEIGANTALARAGAYYHDIGKLKKPQYFSENQAGFNPHDTLSPEESAAIITAHPHDGVGLGISAKLPKTILDIIREHHGTSLVKFFYFKALKEYGAENVKETDYRYKGVIPSSRESAIVMLADTVEAAVRSMLGGGKTLQDAEDVVKTLMKDKLDDGQLDQSGLAIHELETIRMAFLDVFHGMYHERVAYPKQEEIKEAAKKPSEKTAEAQEENRKNEEKEQENREEENSDNTD